eukprot:TRINITY_DN23854_c0_g1_i1.p1 TRINITY_DN23854_c0_g1~~TRINITY_DN23854_c0_g1_i1.p1  ORF type:complete len:252 (-),score=17.36 TRINITY_DN23854_c0_g1_i1:31-786(-)
MPSSRSYSSHGSSRLSSSGGSARSYRSGSAHSSGRSQKSSGSRRNEKIFGEFGNVPRSREHRPPSVATSAISDPVSPTVLKAPPGYSGFAPNVYAGNIFGDTYHRGNIEAALDMKERDHSYSPRSRHLNDSAKWTKPPTPRGARGVSPRGVSPRGVTPRGVSPRGVSPRYRQEAESIRHQEYSPTHPGYSTGANIPGYSGFVAGVYSGNLIATSTPRAYKYNWDPATDGPRPRTDVSPERIADDHHRSGGF